MQTDFDRSVIYEAFETVFNDHVMVGDEELTLEVGRGTMSGNVKLIV